MEEKLALVNCLAALYYDNFQETKTVQGDLIKKAIALIKLPDMVSENDERTTLLALRHLINDIVTGDYQINKKLILQRIRIACPFDHTIIPCLNEVMPDADQLENLSGSLANFVNQIYLFINRNEIKKLINKASYSINNDDGTANLRETISALRQEIEKFDRPARNDGNPMSFVESINCEDDDDVFTDHFKQMQNELNGKALRTGWKALNRMLGVKGGITPGECFVMPALPHNAKTLFSMAFVMSLCLFNKAEDFVEPGQKAMFLDITLENELSVNIPVIYKLIYEHFEGKAVDLLKVDPKEASKYIRERIRANGWTYRFERHISTDFSIETFKQIVNNYEAMGYKIVVARIDYLGVADKTGLSNGAIGSEVRETYRRARNVCAAKKIALISPHQLSPAAKAMRTLDPLKFVRNLPGKGLYDGCTTVDNEVDGEIYLGITDVNGRSFLELQRGKHRTIIETPVKHRYCVLPFEEIGTLPWDVDRDYDVSLPSVNAASMQDEDDLSYLGIAI